jgi:hypothetical protein
MMENIRFTVWVYRGSGSIFGKASSPVNQDGFILTFNDEGRARAECARLNAGSGDPYARYSVEKDLTFRGPYPVTHSDLERRLAELNVPASNTLGNRH